MITIDEVRAWIRGDSKEILFDFALRAADLSISQHEEIERLKRHRDELVSSYDLLFKEAKEWKAFYFEALDKLNNAYERAAQVCDGISGNEPSGERFGALDCAEAIRALKSGEQK